MSAASILHAAAGNPYYPREVEGACRLCGDAGNGIAFDPWVKDTFTNHDLLHPGAIICDCCQFAADDNSVLLQARMGKEKPQRMRNYSHFVVGGDWLPMHKGMKREMLAALRNRPSVAVVALSGQKHLIFRARPGWWQVEETTILPDLPRLERCIVEVEALYRIFSKSEIESGDYGAARMRQYAQAFGIESLLGSRQVVDMHRGTMALEMALFLAQKGELDGVSRAISQGVVPAQSDLEGAERGLQEPVRPHHLAAVREPDSQCSLYVHPEQIFQHSLFADGNCT